MEKAEEVFEDPIEVPTSQWVIRVRPETKFEAAYPDFQTNSILRTSLSYKMRLVAKRDAPTMDLR